MTFNFSAEIQNTYPVTITFLNNGLALAVKEIAAKLLENYPKLSTVRAHELAAAKLAWEFSYEYEALERLINQRCFSQEVGELYDALVEKQEQISLRRLLVDLTKTRTIIDDFELIEEAGGFDNALIKMFSFIWYKN